MRTDAYDFGCTELNDFENPQIQNIEITNPDIASWQFGDSVTIFDITCENISENINSWDEGMSFRFDKSAIKFPITLHQGEKLQFDVEFVATKIGASVAKLTTKSDADEEVTANLSGTDAGTDVFENQQNNLRIYPNPASDQIHIIGLQESTKQIKIFDVLGNERIKYELSITNYELVVDVGDLSDGVYLIQVISHSEIITKELGVVR